MIEMKDKILDKIRHSQPVIWENHRKINASEALKNQSFSFADIVDASSRLDRFAPYIEQQFPETTKGIIESPLVEANFLKKKIAGLYDRDIPRVFMKCDSQLPVAGSIKARGGIHEILAHAESLAIRAGFVKTSENYRIFGSSAFRDLFSRHSISVGSTGNLGISIGIISANLGFKVTVHMSRDAKNWKKELLRSKGVIVIEHEEDYSFAVQKGRTQCREDANCYFVDDEASRLLFTGYSVAALRLREQLKKLQVNTDVEHPLRVYLPCGVGGAPGGIAFGLKQIYGDLVHCWFVEPTHAPCMSLAMITNDSNVKIGDYGIDGLTEADGLAVGSPSALVHNICRNLIDGVITVNDTDLYEYQTLVAKTEKVKIEPSAAAGIAGLTRLSPLNGETAIAWFTGGMFLPEEIYEKMIEKGLSLLEKR